MLVGEIRKDLVLGDADVNRALGSSNCARFEQTELRGDRLRRDIALELLLERVLDKNDQRLPELTASGPLDGKSDVEEHLAGGLPPTMGMWEFLGRRPE